MKSLALLTDLKNLNRTLVSKDNSAVLAAIEDYLPLEIHRYPTDAEFHTWPVPPEWNVIHAELRSGDQVIASYDECPLFVAIYSAAFKGSVTFDELVAHTFTKPEHPESFNYEHRIAADYRRRLKEWRIALPYNRLMGLDKSRHYEVDIQVEVKPGHMVIGEHVLAGRSPASFYFLSHYCHPGQINDGLAGVVTGVEFMTRLRQRHPNPMMTYRFLVLPETFGSAAYCASHFGDLDAAIGAVFSEMPGANSDLQFVHSRRGDTYLDRIMRLALQRRDKPVRLVPFRGGWGNDELMFDSAGVGVPAISLDRFPFPQYHTHHDDMSQFHPGQLDEVVELFLDAVTLMERDYIPRPINRLPVYLTRFNLYSDWTWERQSYDFNQTIIDSLFSGSSVVDIALKFGLDPGRALDYVDQFVAQGLVERIPIGAAYARDARWLPAGFKAEGD